MKKGFTMITETDFQVLHVSDKAVMANPMTGEGSPCNIVVPKPVIKKLKVAFDEAQGLMIVRFHGLQEQGMYKGIVRQFKADNARLVGETNRTL